MLRRILTALATITLICAANSRSQTYLIPLDFGLKVGQHGMVDYQNHPPNVLIGRFNEDKYPDILRFNGSTLELFLFNGQGYPVRPQAQRTFDQPIASLHLAGDLWSPHRDLVVTLQDGREETFGWQGGLIDLHESQGFLKNDGPPHRISEFDFQIVWQSGTYPCGFSSCAVGDLDNDGIEELATYWQEDSFADSACMLIYKCTGDNQYELFMEDWFNPDISTESGATQMLIDDLDQNGLKELIFTFDKCYIWEFSAPGAYTAWTCDFVFPWYVAGLKITDIDQDGILEIAALTTLYDHQPPTAYLVREFVGKNTQSHIIVTSTVTWFYQNWGDGALDIGDFDNDGAIDIVSGNFGYVWNYQPVDVQYFRYDPYSSNPPNFTRNWLYTGLPIRCTNPVVADFDGDAQNELFASGFGYGGYGAAFIWEAIGFQTGSIVWLDTTSAPGGSNESCFGYIDYYPSVLGTLNTSEIPTGSFLILWSYQNGTYRYAWESAVVESTFYRKPHIWDVDHDGKMSLILADDITHLVVDWEQTSASTEGNPALLGPQAFRLGDNYPNPFNAATIIPFEIGVAANVQLMIYNVAGKLVYRYDAGLLCSGKHAFDWNPSGLPSGIYLMSVKAGTQSQIRKGVLMK